jgi:hypothetical protein
MVPGVDGIEQGPRLLGGEHLGLAAGDHVRRPPDRVGGVRGQDLTGDQPVKARPDRGEVLFDGRLGAGVMLDVGRHMDRLDVVDG